MQAGKVGVLNIEIIWNKKGIKKRKEKENIEFDLYLSWVLDGKDE